MLSKRKEEKAPSTRTRDTHMRVAPFLDDKNSRFLVYCFGACHPGFLKTLDRGKDCLHCGQGTCESYRKLVIDNNHIYDPERILAILAKQRQDYLIQGGAPTYRFFPQKEERGRFFFWVKDGGDFLYILRPRKLQLVPEIERDHFRLYI